MHNTEVRLFGNFSQQDACINIPSHEAKYLKQQTKRYIPYQQKYRKLQDWKDLLNLRNY